MPDPDSKPVQSLYERHLSSSSTLRIEESRKSAIPSGVRGSHYVASVYSRSGSPDPLTMDEVHHEHMEAAFSAARVTGEMLARKHGPSGRWRLALNGPGMSTRDTFHIHIIVVGESDEELKAKGYELLRLVDPSSLTRTVPASGGSSSSSTVMGSDFPG
jgi:hypothetical protein